MLLRRRPGEWGPVDWAVAVVMGAAVAVLGWCLIPGLCEDDLEYVGGECVGVTDKAFEVNDRGVEKLLGEVEQANDEVRDEHEDYRQIALMMPFTSDDSSAMTNEMIRHGLAGALAAQKEANARSELQYQLLLAPTGKNLDKWDTATGQLNERAAGGDPLVGVTGIPSSTNETKDAIEELSRYKIPTIGPVVTSTDMKEDYFFKTSPSNKEFAKALDRYLANRVENGRQTKRGFLVWDQNEKDVYSKNLKRAFEGRFRRPYQLDEGRRSYMGGSVKNDDGKITKWRFGPILDEICGSKEPYDTVFFAGRDQDLPLFIELLAETTDCRDYERRIVTVDVGLAATLTKAEKHLKDANATIVEASSVDPDWWEGKSKPIPKAVGDLRVQMNRLKSELGPSHKLGRNPYADGYAAMYYDAFKLLTEAVEQRYDEDKGEVPSKDDVYDQLNRHTDFGNNCKNCLSGASGTYAFQDPEKNERWSVCKPVPVITYPVPTDAEPYRTFPASGGKRCPRP